MSTPDGQSAADEIVARILAATSPGGALSEFVVEQRLVNPALCITVFEGIIARADVAHYWLYHTMTSVYLAAGKGEVAFLLAAMAEKMDPSAASWHLYQHMFRFLISRGRERDAIAVLQKHLEKTPELLMARATEIVSLFQRNGTSLPGASLPRAHAAASGRVRAMRVTEESELRFAMPVPLGGAASLALQLLRTRPMARPAITITELRDATVLIQDNTVLILDSDGALHEALSVAEMPGVVLAKVERLRAAGAEREERTVNSAVVLKDTFSSRNLCHFLLDYMTRIELSRRAGVDLATTAVITESLSAPFMSAIAEVFGVREVIACDQRLRLRVARLLVSDNCRMTFRHPAHRAAPWALDSIRRAFAPYADGEASVRIYVSRRDAAARKVRNEDEVAALLEAAGFRTLVASELTYVEQVKLFQRATHVVGMHGAGLTNIVFCEPGTHFLEIFHPLGNNWDYPVIAAGAQLRYAALVGVDADQRDPRWNDPALPQSVRDEVGGSEVMNYRDTLVPIARVREWLANTLPT